MLYVINPNQDLLKKWLCTGAGLLYKGITIQTSPFQHHVVLRSNEERESAINVFLPPLLSVRQRVCPSTVFSGRHVGWREGQPAVQACQKWERPAARENGEEGALHNECLL